MCHAGYEFFKAVSEETGIECESANGKSNIFSALQNVKNEEICVIADGAAIGPEMNRLYKQAQRMENIKLYLPESFERIILKSGLIEGKDVQASYLRYRKGKLNETYLHDKNRDVILKSIKGIEFLKRE